MFIGLYISLFTVRPVSAISLPPVFLLGPPLRLPRRVQPGHGLRRRRQGVHRPDGHHHRVAVDVDGHAAAVVHGGQQGEG